MSVQTLRTLAEELSTAKGLPLDEVIEHFRASIEAAATEIFADRKVEASFVDDQIGLYLILEVLNDAAQDARQITLEAARKIDPDVSPNDELMLQLHYLGADRQVAEWNAATLLLDPDLAAMLSRWRAAYPGVLDAALTTLGESRSCL